MIKLDMVQLLGKAEGGGNAQLHFRAVIRVPATAFCLPEYGHGESVVPHHFLHILANAAGIAEFLRLEFTAHLIPEAEQNSLVYHRLTAKHIPVVFNRDIDIRENRLIRAPAEAGAGLFPVRRLLFQSPYIPALFKMQVVAESVPADHRVKILGSVLGRAGAQTIEAQGVFIVFPVLAVLTAGVHFAEDQLPVVALFFFVKVHRAAPSKVLNLNAQILVPGDQDGVAIPLPGLVNGVGKNLKNRVLAPLQIVGAKDHRGTFADPVLPFQHGNAGITVLLLLFRHSLLPVFQRFLSVL